MTYDSEAAYYARQFLENWCMSLFTREVFPAASNVKEFLCSVHAPCYNHLTERVCYEVARAIEIQGIAFTLRDRMG